MENSSVCEQWFILTETGTCILQYFRTIWNILFKGHGVLSNKKYSKTFLGAVFQLLILKCFTALNHYPVIGPEPVLSRKIHFVTSISCMW